VNRVKTSLNHKRIQRSIWLVLTILVLLCYSTQNVAGGVYYSIVKQTYGTVASPPVILGKGTAGESTTYANSTSASVLAGVGDFNYVLNMTESQGSNWQVRLRAYDEFNISRLYNCSIYIRNGSNSTQIVISNGDYNQRNGSLNDLIGSDTLFIWLHVETSSVGTSYVYAYLEIFVPNTTTCARYIIAFEIT